MKITFDQSRFEIVKDIYESIESVDVFLKLSQPDTYDNYGFTLYGQEDEEIIYNEYGYVGGTCNKYSEIILSLLGRIDIDSKRILISTQINTKEINKITKFISSFKSIEYKIEKSFIVGLERYYISIAILDHKEVIPIVKELFMWKFKNIFTE